jgi:hypothetical protein
MNRKRFLLATMLILRPLLAIGAFQNKFLCCSCKMISVN